MILGFGPAQPGVLLEEVDKRDDREDLTIFGGLLLQLYPIFAKSRVHLLSGFFGPAERALRDAGHDVAFLPGDFRRFKLFAERMAARVVAITALPPDSDGWLSLSLTAGATVEETLRAGRDPERLLVVETSPRLPQTLGLPPEHRHALHLDDVDILIETDRDPRLLGSGPPASWGQSPAKGASVACAFSIFVRAGIVQIFALAFIAHPPMIQPTDS